LTSPPISLHHLSPPPQSILEKVLTLFLSISSFFLLFNLTFNLTIHFLFFIFFFFFATETRIKKEDPTAEATQESEESARVSELTAGNLAALTGVKVKKKHDTMSLRSLTSVGGESTASAQTDVIKKKKKKKEEAEKGTLDPETVKEFKEFHDAFKILDSFGASSTLPRNFTFKSEAQISRSSASELMTHALKAAVSMESIPREKDKEKKKKKKPLDYTSPKVIKAATIIQAHMRRCLSNKKYFGKMDKLKYTIYGRPSLSSVITNPRTLDFTHRSLFLSFQRCTIRKSRILRSWTPSFSFMRLPSWRGQGPQI